MKEPTQCYICEQPLLIEPAPNRDHVTPKQLFDPTNTPPDLYTLPTHTLCNAGMEKDEEYFRICLHSTSYGQPEATNLWNGPVRRSLQRRDGRFRKMLAQDIVPLAVPVPFYSDSGQYLGDGAGMKFSETRVRHVLEKIVRGLYWKHTERLIGVVRFEIYYFDPSLSYAPEVTLPHLRQMAQTFETGGNVLTYSFLLTPDDPHGSVWWLQFYGKPLFMILTKKGSKSGLV